jgi:tRNA pseudouridine55 synthase
MEGILPLHKPKGMTSHDCVYKIRKLLKTKKVGHTGTLDPEVDGVLPICIGKATKIVQYLTENTIKSYKGEVTLGFSTTTEDFTGDVVEKREVDREISQKEIVGVLELFQGRIEQTPPMYSAVKVKGKRLYEYAREGITIDRPSRQVQIFDIDYLDNSMKQEDGLFSFQFEVRCSKGTYIRTLAVDIGKKLGFPAHMSALTRTASGTIDLNDCVTFDQLAEQLEDGELELMTIPEALSFMTHYEVGDDLAEKVMNGAVLPIPEKLEKENNHFLVVNNKECIAIYQKHPTKEGLMKPAKVLRS